MSREKRIQLFQYQKVRICWDEEHETVTNCHQLKIQTQNGKKRTYFRYLNNNWGKICTPVEMISVDVEKGYTLCSLLTRYYIQLIMRIEMRASYGAKYGESS